MEQEACTGAQGLSPYSAAHVLSKKLLEDLQMDELIKAISGVEQEAITGMRGLTPDLATHVLSDKSLRSLHQMDNLHEETKLLVISLHVCKESDSLSSLK